MEAMRRRMSIVHGEEQHGGQQQTGPLHAHPNKEAGEAEEVEDVKHEAHNNDPLVQVDISLPLLLCQTHS